MPSRQESLEKIRDWDLRSGLATEINSPILPVFLLSFSFSRPLQGTCSTKCWLGRPSCSSGDRTREPWTPCSSARTGSGNSDCRYQANISRILRLSCWPLPRLRASHCSLHGILLLPESARGAAVRLVSDGGRLFTLPYFSFGLDKSRTLGEGQY